jgi:hypothetical protein
VAEKNIAHELRQPAVGYRRRAAERNPDDPFLTDDIVANDRTVGHRPRKKKRGDEFDLHHEISRRAPGGGSFGGDIDRDMESFRMGAGDGIRRPVDDRRGRGCRRCGKKGEQQKG